ncbi:MAG: LytTR family DNA-binding domain-containing protein [Saprospiraceae bacterium]|jgi:two-component system LytT family response regulator|nr:DNA-binding response regulator [Saprospirales bacterium]
MITTELSKTTHSATGVVKAFIVEDEPRGMANLKNLLASHCPKVQVIGEAASIEEGKTLFRNPDFKPDVAFLDIALPDGLVFSLLDSLRPLDFEIIFITAYDQHAIKACEYSSIGYILKPINPDDLVHAINRIRVSNKRMIEQRLDLFSSQMSSTSTNAFDKISVSAVDGIHFIKITDIIRFAADDSYTKIHLQKGDPIIVPKTIKFYEELLEDQNFIRVHKSHVINMNYMVKVVKKDGGYVIMSDGEKIEIAKRRRAYFMEQLKRRGLGF